MNKQKYNTVSIGEAARLTGASIKQIRFWGDRGLIPEPERVVCGKRAYRQFTQKDLDFIKTVKGFLDKGFTLQAAAQKAAENFKKGGN
ncbi:MAG: MerR family transcriptional regulator [Candidatus Cloacimonadota bacterium]|nr:MerR family transcriptional regulator [Candidatus Cloacimonadota bacterium]